MTQIKDISITKTIAENGDFLLMQNPITGETYKITKANLLAALSNGTSGTSTSYPSGMALLLDGGSLIDKSGNNRNASPLGTNSPSSVTGTDGKQVLRWNGSGTQELQISPFLGATSGATLYCVCTINGGDNYNLVRTKALDDYWKFIAGSGYFGTFRSSRFDQYPTSMPGNGSHLISIHADSTTYEVAVDRVSKGVRSSSYDPGDRFRIGVNDKVFTGDIALILVYPEYLQLGTSKDVEVKNKIKQNYPSLPFS
ncbi:MAG: hypothetical protein M3Q64_00020 [bacterium]|nr:hypothetical protein [bacterium]